MKKRDRSIFLHVHRKKKAIWGHSEKVAIYKLGREPSLEMELAGTFTWDFSL